jgi:hypothetical protein
MNRSTVLGRIRKEKIMKKFVRRIHLAALSRLRTRREGMELVQVAILVAIAILIGIVFRAQIKGFVDDVFQGLTVGKFS